ncbi:PorV/PorQ family protein [Candidatus Saganbacteria bacterium]|nr:PorV/PorQ family protein [Candidatus Saganbacteria bacterium]
MTNHVTRYALLIIGFWILHIPCFAAGSEGFAFTKIPQGVKAVSMGGSFTAIADDPSAIYWNPAGLAQLTESRIYSSFSSWLQNTGISYWASNLIRYPHTFGVSFYNLDYGVINETTYASPQGTGKAVNPFENLLSFTYARSFHDTAFAGINLNFGSQNLGYSSASFNSIDAGLLYKYNNIEGLSFGLAFKNYSLADRLPTSLRAGVAYRTIIDNPEYPISSSALSLDLNSTSGNNLAVNSGAEYIFNKTLALRAGLNSRNYTLGLGLMLNNFIFDLAYAPYEDLGNTYRVALNYTL